MVKVKLFGLVRLDSGIKEVEVQADLVKDLFHVLELRSNGYLSKKVLSGCVIFVNGKRANKRTKLCDGDEIQIFSPVAGG